MTETESIKHVKGERNIVIAFYDGGGTYLGGVGVKTKAEVAGAIEALKPRLREAETINVVYRNGRTRVVKLPTIVSVLSDTAPLHEEMTQNSSGGKAI